MFSREESKQIRQQFWIFFDKRYPRKWLLYNTGIKDVVLKFDFDTKKASVAIECTATDEVIRGYYFEKLTSLRNLLLTEVSQELVFEEHHLLESGKEISKIYVEKKSVNIHRKTDWPDVFDFLNEYMEKLEIFFLEYKDFIES